MRSCLPPIVALLVLFALLQPATSQVARWEELNVGEGRSLRCAIVLPDDYDPAKTYPVLLALPPGPQTEAMVNAGLTRYWGEQAKKAGWIVVSPVAPSGKTFFGGAESDIDGLCVRIRERFRVGGGRMHLAGGSNGGRSAFRVATRLPYEFASLVVLPGFAASDEDRARLPRLKRTRVRMFVGGDDARWLEQGKKTLALLKKHGIDASMKVLPGEGHVPPGLDGGVVMKHLRELHAADARSGEEAAVHFAIDDFNDAAAKGDEDRYFGAFAPEGVFLGTDAGERWDLAAFKAFGMRYFQRPSAWIYVPQERHVTLSPEETTAWFDEVVGNRSYGVCRGTGALRKIEGKWKITHYNLTIPVPNDLAASFVRHIASFEAGRPPKTTTVYLVRHAEKESGDDPGLTVVGQVRATALVQVLRSVKVDTVFVTEFKRTRETVAPLCKAKKLEPTHMDARKMKGLAEEIAKNHVGKTVVIAGHSNTLPVIMKALGIANAPALADNDYDDLFVVTLDGGGATMTRLHYGLENPR